MDVGFPRERTCDVNTQIFFGGDALKLSTVQGVLVNRGDFLRETVSDLQVLNLMRLCFDQLFRLPRVICRDWQSQIEVTLLYGLVSSAYNPTLIFTPVFTPDH